MQTTDNIRYVKTIKTPSDILCVKYTDEKKSFAAGFMDGSVQLYNIKTGDHEITLADDDTKNIDNAITGIIHREGPVRHLLTCSYSGGLIKQWNYLNGHCMFTIKEKKRQTCGIAYHPKLPKIFSYGDDGRILLYDEETRKNEAEYKPSERQILDGHISKIMCVSFNPASPNEFISGGWDETVQFWDVRRPYAIRYISDVFIGGEGLAINKDGTELITCEWRRENPMKVWNYSTGKLIQIIKPDAIDGQLYVGKYLTNNLVVTGGSDMNIFRLINMTSYSTLSSVRGFPGGIFHLDFLPTKKQIEALYDLGDLPNVVLCSGKCLYDIKFQ